MYKYPRICISPYPDGKSFAFTVIDDTDRSTLEICKPVYEHLISLGLRTTKTVWVKEAAVKKEADDYGDTTERGDYLEYLNELQLKGYEIALHNVSSGDNLREDILEGVDRFRMQFGEYPSINVMHDKNKENLYFDAFLEYFMNGIFCARKNVTAGKGRSAFSVKTRTVLTSGVIYVRKNFGMSALMLITRT